MSSLRTASVFMSGRPTYLRFTQFTKERMVTVECIGVTNPGSYVNVSWDQPTGANAIPPKPGARVQVHNLHEGVMHIVNGEVLDVSGGSKPKIRIRAEEHCLAVPLRRHPRHLVKGKVKLGNEGDKKYLNQASPSEMDISMGGFGINVPDKDYKQGDHLDFCLELDSQDLSSPGDADITYQVLGRAEIRRAAKQENGIQLGFQFIILEGDSKQCLEHWMAVQGSVFRKA